MMLWLKQIVFTMAYTFLVLWLLRTTNVSGIALFALGMLSLPLMEKYSILTPLYTRLEV